MTDYVAGHLQWIKNNPKFVPKESADFTGDIPYYEIMHGGLYSIKLNFPGIQAIAKKLWIADKAWQKASYALTTAIDKEVNKMVPTANGLWFITIGFNHQTWSVKECVKVIQKILGFDWIIKAKANFELHRENGEHPHCHFLIETNEVKSRILDKLFRPQYVKNVVLDRKFIDVKPGMDYHYKYINFEKVEEKSEHVEKDREWRIREGIPDFEKNWTVV